MNNKSGMRLPIGVGANVWVSVSSKCGHEVFYVAWNWNVTSVVSVSDNKAQ